MRAGALTRDLQNYLQGLFSENRRAIIAESRASIESQQKALNSLSAHAEARHILHREQELFDILQATAESVFDKYVDLIEQLCSTVLIKLGVPLLAASGSGHRLDTEALNRTTFQNMAAQEKHKLLGKVFAARGHLREMFEDARSELLKEKRLLDADYDNAIASIRALDGGAFGPVGPTQADVIASVERAARSSLEVADRKIRKGYEALHSKVERIPKAVEQKLDAEKSNAQRGRAFFLTLGIVAVIYFSIVWAARVLLGDSIGLAAGAVGAAGIAIAFVWKEAKALIEKNTRIKATSKKQLEADESKAITVEVNQWTDKVQADLETLVPSIVAQVSSEIESHVLAHRKEFMEAFGKVLPEVVGLSTRASAALNGYAKAWQSLHTSMVGWYVTFAEDETALIEAAENMKQGSVEPALHLFRAQLATVSQAKEQIEAIVFETSRVQSGVGPLN